MSGDLPRTPTLAELLQRAGQALLDGMHVCLPARVESYDATLQAVSAQPLIQREVLGEDGETIVERLPVVTRCPVKFPGSGPYRITWPIAVGSVVVLHFTSASIDRWLAIGGEVVAEDGRKLTLSDAFADPGGHSFAGETAPATTAPEDAMVMHAAALKLGGPEADDEAVRRSDLGAVVSKLNAVITAFNAHTHAVATTGTAAAQSGTAAATASPVSAASAATGSPTVKLL